MQAQLPQSFGSDGNYIILLVNLFVNDLLLFYDFNKEIPDHCALISLYIN